MNQPANIDQRVIQRDGQWYFKVRNEQTEGPYTSREDAEAALHGFVRSCQNRLRFSLRSFFGSSDASNSSSGSDSGKAA